MKKNNSRRDFLKTAGYGLIAAPLTVTFVGFSKSKEPDSHEVTPVKPGKSSTRVKLNILDFGAIGDGTTKNTASIQQALDRCWLLGGGEVIIPSGNYLTGAIARNINVTGFAGPLLGINNVSGTDLKGAVAIEQPKIPDVIPANIPAFQLK